MRSLFCSVLVLVLAPLAGGAEPVRIAGETKYKPQSLVRLKAEGVDAKAALLWRVYPSKDVQRATGPRGVLEFAAHPGTYEVELLVITNTDGVLEVGEARTAVTIESCTPVPPKPDPKPPEGKPDPEAALGRIRFGTAGCTATVVGPRRPDGKWDVLTAAHCVSGVGARGTLTLKDGRSFGLRVVAYHKTPDVAWCVTDDAVTDLPYAVIAESNPPVDTPVWHMGFGVDKPGNREDGTVAERENAQGQLRMVLSVSSGDSGGGIFRADTNELVSVVCCTSGMARKVSMWGCSAEVARRTRSKPADDADEAWVPVPIPICKDGKRTDTGVEWTPHPIPIRTVSSATK
ncbi:MAG: serine protease [Fimbriiglobus sp.]|nr:serine protease [Fimbriiglobus sp.]